MGNLLHLVVALAEEPDVRRTFRADPDAALVDLDGITGEDVAASADLARIQVEPELADRLTSTLDLRARDGETDRDVAVRALLAICDALEST